MIRIADVTNKYFYLFADCSLVKGFTRTMVCDISRHKLYFIDNSFYDLLLELKKNSIGEVIEMLDDTDSYEQLEIFINYLLDIEIGEIIDDITLFPPIDIFWDHPSPITNAIIDVRHIHHDYQNILTQLNDLYCEFLQIRSYEVLSSETLLKIINEASGKNFRMIEFIIKFDAGMPFDLLLKTVSEYTFVQIVFFGCPENFKAMNSGPFSDRIQYTSQDISSCDACGIINRDSFSISTIRSYMENTLYNGCLNRKISIDENGKIKNCPSMAIDYGDIKDTTLSSVLEINEFRQLWSINKDQISICSDCEYRRICTDCRAYTVAQELYSKPAKCGYDPYSGRWSDQLYNDDFLSQPHNVYGTI